jgi:hypothetical protein
MTKAGGKPDLRTQQFMALCEKHGIPKPQVEWRFHGERKWRFDYAWIDAKLALEVEGGAFSGGRHTRGAGFREDIQKYNAAALLGWTVLRTLPENLYDAMLSDTIVSALHLLKHGVPIPDKRP